MSPFLLQCSEFLNLMTAFHWGESRFGVLCFFASEFRYVQGIGKRILSSLSGNCKGSGLEYWLASLLSILILSCCKMIVIIVRIWAQREHLHENPISGSLFISFLAYVWAARTLATWPATQFPSKINVSRWDVYYLLSIESSFARTLFYRSLIRLLLFCETDQQLRVNSSIFLHCQGRSFSNSC